MMETELYSSRVFSPFREESGDEELSVLPRHTKVIVTGNNRTKSVLVGLQGVVKKAVGLGGWHWLVLKNGVEVKLQRNALSVLEPPTGHEEDDEYEFDISSSGSDINEFPTPNEFSKLNKPKVRYARPWGLSPSMMKSGSRNACRETQSNMHMCYPKVNFSKLGTNTLWRYYSTFNLGNIHSNPTKEQLVNAVRKHFASQKVSEMEAIMEFINAAKGRKSGRNHRDRS
ncbi:putative histone deacetylase complex subunit SAP30/SAP30, SAP30 domain superfamily [Helianthus annuus]|nr:putative histone deacetylase complex subunit SAP30/SAP30, SAP30 domain superfamily [Helianthus annuus]